MSNDWLAVCGGLTNNAYQTVPTTTWYTADSIDCTARRRIDVEWFVWRDKYLDPSTPIPPGWTKVRRAPDDILSNQNIPCGYGEYFFKHKSTTDRFWYLIPLSDPNPKPSLRPHTRFLFATVQTARLYIRNSAFTIKPNEANTRRRLPRSRRHGSELYVSLYDPRGRWAGILRPHNYNSLVTGGEETTDIGQKVQCIVISQGSISNHDGPLDDVWDLDEYGLDERPKEGERYEYYNVLRISWTDGIAYREAAGRVHKDIWDSLEPESIDVVLG